MRIKKIISQSRRDFAAIYECEHCEKTIEGSGYDDTNFHRNAVPKMKCESCGKNADDTYRPLETMYHDSEVI